jgi:RNA polymerase sigma factor (sigma-70 family)
VDQLLALARQGDKKAEEALFDFLLVRFTLIAKRRLGEEEARDAAQDACLTVLQKYRTEAPAEKFEAWAYGVLRRKIGNQYQKQDVRGKIMGDVARIEETAQDAEGATAALIRRRLLGCLRLLVRDFPRYARVLTLVYQGFTTAEISRRLRVKPGHVYVLLNRGREMLGACIDKGGVR